MCQFGDETRIIRELEVPEDKALVGYRGFHLIKDSLSLRSLNINFIWPKDKPCEGDPTRHNSEGIYNYNYYNNYNYNNNDYNYNNYNYNYNNYYYYNYNYNYNYNYYIAARTKLYGTVFEYKDGYRSSRCIVTELVILDSIWKENPKKLKGAEDFYDDFNQLVGRIAKEYNCKTITCEEYFRCQALKT